MLNFSVRPSVCLSHPWRGPLRHVYSHTYHRTAMIHTLVESPSDLDVHAGIRFWVFEKNSSKLASKSTLYGYVILTQGSIVLRLRANYLPYSKDLQIFGKPNGPGCPSREAFCFFFSRKSSKLTSRNWPFKTTKFGLCGRTPGVFIYCISKASNTR